MAYPTAKVHRSNRRKLGRGQYPASAIITTSGSWASTVLTMTFSDAVNVSGLIPLILTLGTVSSQLVLSPTSVQFNISGAAGSQTATLPNNPANVMGQRGQPIAGCVTAI